MNQPQLALFAGIAATTIFIGSNLPMLWKARETRNLASYSLLQIALSNAGNMINWLYVVSLPPGPIWLLHLFNSGVALLMLYWYLRYEYHRPSRRPLTGLTSRRADSHANPA